MSSANSYLNRTFSSQNFKIGFIRVIKKCSQSSSRAWHCREQVYIKEKVKQRKIPTFNFCGFFVFSILTISDNTILIACKRLKSFLKLTNVDANSNSNIPESIRVRLTLWAILEKYTWHHQGVCLTCHPGRVGVFVFTMMGLLAEASINHHHHKHG